MKNKILLFIAFGLITVLFSVRYYFSSRFTEFKLAVSKLEASEGAIFNEEKSNRVNFLSQVNNVVYQYFLTQFDTAICIEERDTTFSFLYLSKKLKYNIYSIKYIDCLSNKCFVDYQNEVWQQLVTIKEAEVEKKYGETFQLWYPKLRNHKILKKKPVSVECSLWFPDSYELMYDTNVWNDFSRFMDNFILESEASKMSSTEAEKQFSSQVSRVENQLAEGAIRYFENLVSVNREQILKKETETRIFKGNAIGEIEYRMNMTTFNVEAFQKISNDALNEQWKFNSLRNGTMPYSYCFGSNNYCSDDDCSEIKIITGNAELLVTIKDIDGDIIRHAFIKEGHSFTFNVPDGSYQVFFYSGIGWNPNKIIATVPCGTLKGGFVSNENFQKVDYSPVYHQIRTIEYILQEGGNLEAKPSSMAEAFN